MKKSYLSFLIISVLSIMSLSAASDKNPFFEDWDTPYGIPPFEKIKIEHYVPAFEKALEDEKAEIQAIVDNREPATFENTIVAMDRTGSLRSKVSGVFSNLVSADTSEALREADRVITPMLSAHSAEILLNEKLFERVKEVYQHKEELQLDRASEQLLKDTYLAFVRNGALLEDKDKVRYKEMVKKISVLSLKYAENVLKDANSYEIVIDDESQLDGVSELIIEAAATKAKERGYDGKWLFLPTRATVEPITTFAHNRELRRKLFEGYTTCGDRGNEYDNNELATKIINLRLEKAQLLGYKTHADYVLDITMAKTPDRVMALIEKVWDPAIKTAKKEIADMQQLIKEEGHDFKLEAWDYRYYAEKIRASRYALDVEELAPYFTAENVKNGIFELMNRLYGVTIEKEANVPTYLSDVDAWRVTDADGSLVGLFLSDFNLRDSKRAGAWMSAYRAQMMDENGKRKAPIIVNVCNFPNAVGDTPSLLTIDQVTTAFHEFGHATHGLFSQCEYKGQAGTSVKRDFVELPSQILENWAFEPALLKEYAFHYETGEVISDQLIEKIQNSSYFNQGFFTMEYLAAAVLDMEYHMLNTPLEEGVSTFEKRILNEKYGLVDEIYPRYRSTYFQHIFCWSYSAGYYSYLWAAVLDADAFNAFKETDLFNKEVAQRFRDEVLSQGGSGDPMEMYLRFRGAEPKTDPLLRRRGFIQ